MSAAITQHPIYKLLRQSSSRNWERDDAAINALGLSKQARSQVANAARLANAVALDGAMQDAEQLAADRAEEIIEALPEEQQAPDYLDIDDEEPDGPEALAARVGRW